MKLLNSQGAYIIRLNNRHALAGHVLTRNDSEGKPLIYENERKLRRKWSERAADKQCLEKMENNVGDNHPGTVRLATAVAKAERLIAHELALLNWTGEDLLQRPKRDPLKLALAARLRRETTLSIKQIAERLSLGRPKGAKSNLHSWMNANSKEDTQPKVP